MLPPMRNYSLRKSRRILRNAFKLYHKKKHLLGDGEAQQFETDLRALDKAVLEKNKPEAVLHAKAIEGFVKKRFPKTLWQQIRELAYALVFAIIVAFLIRQFWFELYEVPTGSMRPTVAELDRMVVSKTTFGINSPLRKKPYLFSDDYINRAGIVVFTVADMDVPDATMLYFKLFPGKKRYIKRCVAKPGDTIYFYGGYIYAIDRNGQPHLEQANEEFLKQVGIERIEHIPYITQDGKSKVSRPAAPNVFPTVTMKQMNSPVAKFEFKGRGEFEGIFFNGKEWVPDSIEALKTPHDHPVSYSDLWGIGNYAMARLLTRGQVEKFYGEVPEGEESVAYLELHHTPNLTYPKPQLRPNEMGLVIPMMTPFTSIIPLKLTHLKAIQAALFTARFHVRNGQAYRYHELRGRPQRPEFDVRFPGVPNGCYEFYYGKGYKIHFGGIRSELPTDHPLYNSSPENIMKLFNLGINFNILFEPNAPFQPFNPQRFAYYRNRDLYVMGAPILKKSDPTLIRFVQTEIEKQNQSSREKPFIAFVDHGPPLKEDGSLNIEFIKSFGLKVPDNGLIALGDNYAMSADSRDFGPVPTENLRGAPSFTFWPPGPRIGPLPQPSYPWLTLPNLIIWILAAVIIISLIVWIYRRNQRSLFI